jgi:hypothetical protein
VVFRRNTFYNNDIINWRGGCDGMIVENNFFGASNHAFSVQFHGDDAIIRFNVLQGDIQNTGSGESDNQVWLGNVGPTIGSSCPNPLSSGVVGTHNVWSRPTTCGGGANNTQTSNFSGWFVNAGEPFDGHITSSATGAINKVPAASCPTTDFDGNPFSDFDEQTRPIDTNCDAGADERDD